MPFDATFLTAVTAELKDSLIGCRIDKVQQPDRHCLVLTVRSRDHSGRLLLCASPNTPRVHFTEVPLENPAQPPMFCMLLRKHLVGARIADVTQPPLERLLDFTLDCTDEMGEPCRKHLIAELMGRSANLILCGADGRIVDCLRRVDFEASEKRQVLPGLFYHLPPLQKKLDPAATDAETLSRLLAAVTAPTRLDKWLLDTFGGLSPLVCRELSFLATGETDADITLLPDRPAAAAAIVAYFSAIAESRFTPTMLLQDGRPKEFSYAPILQYGSYLEKKTFGSFSRLLDDFYARRDQADRMRQRTATIHKTVTTCYERVCRKLETQKKELAGAADRERLRQLGDILTANIHAITRGQTSVTVTDFYDPDMKEITVPLSPTLSPQQNAAKFYKDYTKAKTAEKILTEQIRLGKQEKEYLASILDELSRAETEKDVAEIRQELIDGGYIRDTEKKKMKAAPSRPMRFTSSEGFAIYVGRNNRQNDLLTLKTAFKNDLWLHTQKIHGSHVIIECRNEHPGDVTVTEAAMLAAWFSQARESAMVPVDYALVKHVKKPAGAKPGMVIYDHYKTAYVTPDPHLAEKLSEPGGK